MPLFSKLFGQFYDQKTFLGVDIGSTSIKVAQLKPGKKPELVNYAVLENPRYLGNLGDSGQKDNLKTLDKTAAELLKSAVSGLDLKNSEVVASVQAFSAFATLVELPLLAENETSEAIQLQAKQLIPLPLDEITVDWVKVGEKSGANGEAKQQALLVAVPNEVINKYKNIFQSAGLNLVGLEVEGLSLARALTRNLPEPVLIADIGARSTGILIAQKGFLKFMEQTDFSGSSITQNLSSGAGLSALEAEELKRKTGLAAGGDPQLSTLIQPIADVIINEARQVKETFEKTYQEKVGRVLLTGGGAKLRGLNKYFSENLGLPAAKANPFSAIAYPPEMEPLVEELSPLLAISIGLALRNTT